MHWRPDASAREPGAYALWITLDEPLELLIPRLDSPALPAGCYVYCGSARGAGGIRARVARHLRGSKPTHWHVDHLTATGRVAAVRCETGGSECDLVNELLDLPGAHVPVPGFGSTDCRRCPSHLIGLIAPPDPQALGFLPCSPTGP